jgi:methionyl-tRNA formyltransferase
MDANPGEVVSNGKDEIFVKTGGGAIKITELQLQGKKRMKTVDFLRGNEI